ncbi:proteasome-type protease [Oscillatoria sp. CS-180]|uniref:proteasome-type protease n=1 Tax=Oscillatoria sp. CS-180 TaxID=3021720 RepID=UPI00232D0021|nr:proteasome-type protease [Oscillatoria sp. CS-180]MDB9525633.1 proteasome-type protease [Oscillatoria sp. CS-180]
MTYCLGIHVRCGVLLAADSRTNAGVDYISSYRKLFDFSVPDDRALILCTSGNLSVTQAVLHALERDIVINAEVSLHNLPTMYDIARYIGSCIRNLQEIDRSWLQKDKIDFQCNFLLAGQVKGESPHLYLIYSQGNCIKSTPETPFLQIGETKYGKPILDRTLTYESSIEDVAKYALLSIDSTMRSNLSVGPPINLVIYKTDSFKIDHKAQFCAGDPYLIKMRKHWEVALRKAAATMPAIEWNSSAVPDGPDLSDISEP